MTRFKKMSFVVITASYLNGCSVIQDWFPDKEKDYQFTTELPPLIIPPDLVQKPKLQAHAAPVEMAKPKIEKAIESAKTAVSQQAEKIAKVEQAVATEIETTVSRPQLSSPEIAKNEIQISLTHENVPSLNLNVPTVRAWRIVSKALSRSGIEVTKHEPQAGQITVQITEKSEKSKPEEDSFFSGTSSVFSGFVNDEQRYVLQFQETSENTSITVLDSDLQPLKNVESEKLLSTLFESIKTDLSK